jgi:DnaJ-class molecular chaperone
MPEIEVECGECMASGEVGNDDEVCLHCHGTGNAPEAPGWEMPGHSYWKTCPVCERTDTNA